MNEMEKLHGFGRWTQGGNGSHWAGCDETHWDCRILMLEGLLKELWPVVEEYHRVLRYHMMRRQNDKKFAELAARVRAAVREE